MTTSDDFYDIERRAERLYENGRQLFLQGKHDDAIECFKQIYRELVIFRDVEKIVEDFYTTSKDEWIVKYQPRFEKEVA